MKVLLKNGKSADGAQRDLAIDGETIVESSGFSPDETLDLAGKVILPGFVDLHTHLREPGKEDSETVLSGSRAAAKGGFTAISAMANTLPVADTAGVVEQVYRLGQEAGLVDVFPVGAITQGLAGNALAEIGAMADSPARVRIFSDDGHCVSNSVIMRRALEYVKQFDGVVAQHAQDPALTVDSQMNEGEISSMLGLRGWPAVAEEAIIARDVLLADHVGARLHICHVTTRGGVEIIRWAKARGIQVTAEVTPHHLLLTDERAKSYDPIFKVNPPLRTEGDVMALREALADGTIDVIATDHAPHPAESKECEWQEAAFGMLGLETAFSIAYLTMVQSGLITLETLVDRMSSTPAKIGRYEDHGRNLAVGSRAHLVVIDPTATWRVDKDLVLSKSRNTPFHGMELPGVISHTMYNGEFSLRDGEVTA